MRTSSDIGGLRITTHLTSAEPDVPIGGDWYLTMPLPDGEVLLAVGDALGHGLAAASTMLRLRHSMATLASQGISPAGILGRLNTTVCRTGTVAAASAIVARYRPADGRLTWARAGHPPILTAGPHRTTHLPDNGGPLLGVIPGISYHHTTYRIQPQEQVVLYTDGLIAREQTIDDWLTTIAAQIHHARGDVDALLSTLDYRSCDDDSCILIAERLPAPAALPRAA